MAEEKAELTVQQTLDSIKDSPEFAAALNAHGKTVLETNKSEIYGKAQGEAFGHLDTLAKDVLGITIERGTKTTDLYKPLLEELVTLRSNKGASSEDVTAALATQKTAHELQITALSKTIEESEKTNANLLKGGTERDIQAAISKELQGKTFKAHYTKSDLKLLLDAKNSNAISGGKIENGTIVYYNADGTKRLNSTGLAITTAELVQADYGEMYQIKTAGGDADAEPNKDGGLEGDGEEKKLKLNMADIKTREQFFTAANKILTAQGLASHMDDYNKLYKDAMQEYSYNALPVK